MEALGYLGIHPALALSHLVHALEEKTGIGSLEHHALGTEPIGRQELGIVHPSREQNHNGSASDSAKLAQNVEAAAFGQP